MKKISYYILAVLMFCHLSCNDDFLDTQPGNAIDDAAVWNSPAYAEQFLFAIYFNMPFPRQWLEQASLTDEASFVQVDGVSTRVTESNMTADDKGGMGSGNWADGQQNWNWNNVFRRIRECNLFLEKIDEVPITDDEKRKALRGEAYWLRAYNYFLLVKQYGGVPLIDKTYEYVQGADYSIARNSFEESVNFIVRDLDEAAALLPTDGPKTRATKGAALALKSRVLLYAASDLYNTNAAWAPGYSQPGLISNAGGSQQARWQLAKDAAKAVIDLGLFGLYKANPAPGDDMVENLTNIVFVRSEEDIFLQYYDAAHYFYYYQTDWAPIICGAPGYGGFALNQPIGNLADAFEKSDGTKFNWSNPLHSAAPYADRDPRFYATMLHDGATWFGRQVETGQWTDGSTGLDFGGATGTGYYLRKFIDPNFNHVYYAPRPNTPFTFLRYAEILLNYAEACIGLGQDAEARTYINMVRARAGMPPVSDAGAALEERCRNERRVELAYEEHRFWDVRRWMIADQAYVPAMGVDVAYPVLGSTASPIVTQRVVEPNRKWKDNHYFIPIATDELNKNPKLVQNPMY